LIERLGNVRARFLAGRIEQILRRLFAEGLMDSEDVVRVGVLYQDLIFRGKITNEQSSSPDEMVKRILQAV
jgi:hypothetical protein